MPDTQLARPRALALNPRAFLVAVIAIYIGLSEAAIILLPIPAGVAHILEIIVGVLIAKFGTVYDYYFGAAKGGTGEGGGVIPLSSLSDLSDMVAFVALFVFALIYGVLPPHLVLGSWVRRMREVATIFFVGALRRGAGALHLQTLALALWIALAVIAALAAATAVVDVVREARRGAAPPR